MMGRNRIENEGLGLFRARRKNSRKWLEGYYIRTLETAADGTPAVRHFIIFQKTDGSGQMRRAEAGSGTLCRCIEVVHKNLKDAFYSHLFNRDEFDNEKDANNDEIIRNIFDCLSVLKYPE